jgi:hypothetical protein
MVNEFHNRNYDCPRASFIPSYGNIQQGQSVCSAVGAVPGQTYVNGDDYINS